MAEHSGEEVSCEGPNNKPILGGLLLSPFSERSYRSRRDLTGGGEYSVVWDDEFERLCNLTSFGSWDLGFTLLSGERGESKSKMAVLGKVSLNLRELGSSSSMESQIQRKLPMVFKIKGIRSEATLLVCVSIMEESNSESSLGEGVQKSSPVSDRVTYFSGPILKKESNSNESSGMIDHQEPCPVSVTGRTKFLDRFTYLNSFKRPAASPEKENWEAAESHSLPGSPKKASACSQVGSNVVNLTTDTELESSLSTENQADSASRIGFSSLKKRRLSFAPNTLKRDEEESSPFNNEGLTCESIHRCFPLKVEAEEFSRELDYWRKDYWQRREILSRSGQTKLKTNVLFASLDQRSKLASGAGACSALAVVIAHWLHSNEDLLPTRLQFDSLIIQGSSEWRRLCSNEAYLQAFPDRHFDIETVLEAEIRSLAICPKKSFIGFFSPGKFENLKEAMSFDKIWDELTTNDLDFGPRIFIVSWNDHFFVMKMEEDAYYIIDSYGERLYKGCRRAYILKFDDSSVMHENIEQAGAGSEEMPKSLQIELHYSYLNPSSPSSSASSSGSPSSSATWSTCSNSSAEENT
ncbi:EEIG1/EHBP1 protein amino-terminal domain protein [Trema orientale]|uniref:EEIG1/EHBP1 protein amino-terminal domain protein n=1 Tax=Trema orientale TaxID=63057 RepID=A0A2P5E788_TREOI|nr:EEIG1/EHBP1 protein amino-terminal domain protein [Trema orientale]